MSFVSPGTKMADACRGVGRNTLGTSNFRMQCSALDRIERRAGGGHTECGVPQVLINAPQA